MALSRFIVPSLSPFYYFDDVFSEMDREIARMHHDMRSAMHRLEPLEQISQGGDSLATQLRCNKDPITTNEDGTQTFGLQCDLHAFKPDEIKVKTEGNEVSVEARHEEKSENSRVLRQVSRHYTLPKGVDPNALTSSLSRDGILSITAPCSAKAIEIPVEKKAIQ